MNKTGADPRAWFKALQYSAYILNLLARKNNRWKTPLEVATGETPDISACLEFTFWQKVLYLSYDESFPDSKELPGRFLGVLS